MAVWGGGKFLWSFKGITAASSFSRNTLFLGVSFIIGPPAPTIFADSELVGDYSDWKSHRVVLAPSLNLNHWKGESALLFASRQPYGLVL